MKFHGYNEARAQVAAMTLDELLALIDALYGRDNLRYGATLEEVRDEAYAQQARDWEAPPGYNTRTDKWETFPGVYQPS